MPIRFDVLTRAVRNQLPSDPPRRGTFGIHVLPMRELLCRASSLGVPQAASYYHPATREVVLRVGCDRAGAIHEIVHAVMDVDWNVTSPEWICEGFAELVTARVMGTPIPHPQPISLESAERVMGREVLYGPGFADHYRTCAGHVAWLCQREGMRKTLERFRVR